MAEITWLFLALLGCLLAQGALALGALACLGYQCDQARTLRLDLEQADRRKSWLERQLVELAAENRQLRKSLDQWMTEHCLGPYPPDVSTN